MAANCRRRIEGFRVRGVPSIKKKEGAAAREEDYERETGEKEGDTAKAKRRNQKKRGGCSGTKKRKTERETGRVRWLGKREFQKERKGRFFLRGESDG